MSRARDLADFISTGSIGTGILADGAVDSTEITGVTVSATEINHLGGVTSAVQTQLDTKIETLSDLGVTATSAELNYVDGVTSNIQSQLDNISVTSGSLTKSFTSGESATITLAQSITPAPVVSVTKEVAQTGQSSKGAWDVNATASNYDLHNTAYATTLTPSTLLDVTAATYDSNSRSTGGSYGPRLSSDGLKLFVNDQGANNIRQYNLSTAWLLPSSATHTTFSTASQVNDETGFCFSDNGLHFYLCDQNGSGSNMLHQYSITSGYPYDLVGYGSFTRTVNMTSLGEAAPATRMMTSVLVEDSGTKMYIFSGSGSSALIRQYTLSTAYDISSATYANKSFDVYADYGSGGYLGNSSLSSDGKQLLLANGADDIVMHYTLGTAWDISTASRVGIYNPAEDANVSGVHLKPDNSKFFMLGGSNQTFYRYSLGSSGVVALGTGSFASTDVGKRIQGNGGDVILTSTAGAYDTTGGSDFTDSSTIASGSWTMHGLKSAGDADGLTLAGKANSYDIANSSNIQTYGGINNYADFPSGLYVRPDGSAFYYVDRDSTRRRVYEFPMSTPYDLSTATYADNYYVGGEDTSPMDVKFKPDGTKMYVLGDQLDRIFQYDLSTPWNFSSASYNFIFKGVNHASSTGFYLKPDGTTVYTIGTDGNCYQHTMSTAWDISTAGSYVATKDIGAVHGLSDYAMVLSDDGTKAFFSRQNDGTVYQWNLSTAWDISTASYSSISFSYSSDIASLAGLYFGNGGEYIYLIDYSTQDMNRYTVGSFSIPTSQYNLAVTNASGQIDSQFWQDINSMTADQSLGDGEAYYAVSTDDRTTWSVAKASDGVRPIVRDNAGTWQYNTAVTTVGGSVASASYDSVSAQFTINQNAYEIHWRDSGNLLFVQDSGGNQVVKYTASTPYDVTTLTQSQTYSFSGQEIYETSFYISPDGLHFYIAGSQNPGVHEYSLSTAYDLTTVSYDGKFLLAGSTAGTISFKPDGTRIYVGYYNTNAINTWPLTTAWDTSSYGTMQSLTPTEITRSTAIQFNADGTKMFVMDTSVDKIFRFNLSTAYDITTATKDEEFLYSAQTTQAQGFAFNNDFTKMNISGSISGSYSTIYQYSSTQSSYTTSATWTNATTNDEFYALQQALGATEFNRMDKTQLDAVADGSHFTLGNTLDLMIALKQDTASASLPTSDGVTINYDAAALNQGAVLGTDYDYDFPANNKVRITSNAAQNLKIRVV
ncbi:hypothetical protein CRP2_gp51 [Roseobacter phage CRP-2]|nr:hypothetical protein CRP2_gp51 [Roseobacter phage CRP-2]